VGLAPVGGQTAEAAKPIVNVNHLQIHDINAGAGCTPLAHVTWLGSRFVHRAGWFQFTYTGAAAFQSAVFQINKGETERVYNPGAKPTGNYNLTIRFFSARGSGGSVIGPEIEVDNRFNFPCN